MGRANNVALLMALSVGATIAAAPAVDGKTEASIRMEAEQDLATVQVTATHRAESTLPACRSR